MSVEGDAIITHAGKEFATAGVHRSHEIFKEQLAQNVPFANTVVEALTKRRMAASAKDFCSIFSTSTFRRRSRKAVRDAG